MVKILILFLLLKITNKNNIELLIIYLIIKALI